MRALIQRTSGASVTVDGSVIGEIGAGLVIFVCAMRGDGEAESDWLARKCVNLRIFRDDEGRMNRSILDVGGSALVVSQFTLAAETKGNRPASRPRPSLTRASASTSILPRRLGAMEFPPPPAPSVRT